MEQAAILDVLRRHAWMIIVLSIVASAAGYAFTFLLSEQYAASTLVLVRPQQPIKMGSEKESKEFLDFPMAQSTSVETPSKTYIEIIKSPELIGEVVTQLGLDKEEAPSSGRITKYLPAYFKGIAEDVKAFLKTVPDILKFGRVIEQTPFAKAVKGIEDNISLKSVAETYVFEIKYTTKEADQAAAIANTTASLFIKYMENFRQSEAHNMLGQLRVQLDQSRKHLESAREKLEIYKKAHSVFLYETEYNSELKIISDLEIELAKAEEALVGSQSTLSSASLAARRQRLLRLIDERKANLVSLPGLERELRQLEQDVKDALNAYEIVDKSFREADIKYSYEIPDVRLVSQAAPPRLPSAPLRGTITLASLLSGLVVALFLAFVLEYLNPRVRSIQDIEDFVGVKVLTTIPRISRRRWRHAGLL
jgi:uncharacterized protein involved in exopolysaccharide biosynthesis